MGICQRNIVANLKFPMTKLEQLQQQINKVVLKYSSKHKINIYDPIVIKIYVLINKSWRRNITLTWNYSK